MGTKTYDSKCVDLAGTFLSDEAWFNKRNLEDRRRFISELAGDIQTTIEDEIQHLRDSLHVED